MRAEVAQRLSPTLKQLNEHRSAATYEGAHELESVLNLSRFELRWMSSRNVLDTTADDAIPSDGATARKPGRGGSGDGGSSSRGPSASSRWPNIRET